MMLTPYRGTAPTNDVDSEAREVELFARQMHAERRIWSNDNFGKAILATLMVSTCLFLVVGRYLMVRVFELSSALMLAPALLWLVLGISSLVAWRRATRRA